MALEVTEPPAYRVRPLIASDKPAWRDLFDGYIVFYDADVPELVIELTWGRLIESRDGMVGLVAADADNTAVGIAHLVFHASTWSPTSYCYLEDIFVHPALRGQGIGRLLMNAVYAEADRRGATRTYWMTGDHNIEAQALYNAVARKAPFIQYRR
jgi:GNAT superfamily N-acetyltransferase